VGILTGASTDISFPKAWSTLGWNEKVLVTGMTLWGGRLFSRMLARTLAHEEDDVRYEQVKQEKDFWSKALFTQFLPEALFQAVITLPFTISFRALPSETFHAPSDWYQFVHSLAVGLFSAGFILETLADAQLDKHKLNSTEIKSDGVWSIVRHPKYVSLVLRGGPKSNKPQLPW
jgi:steroid 5-alpha reductase family enzyme